jgi:DNA-binding IclR family transcriptional regulator
VTDPTGFIRHIERARKDEYVTSVREYEDQVISIGVPILAPDGNTIASISIAAPAARMPSSILRDHAQLLQAAAKRIRTAIGRPSCRRPD